MPAPEIARVSAEIDKIYRKDSRRIFATLIRLLGDFERAEEALHDAFRAAMEKWPAEGLPQNPVSWLVSAGRFKSIDKQRRDQRFDHLEDRPDVAESLTDQTPALDEREDCSKTTACAWCSPAAIRRSRPTRRWRSRCAKSAASPPKKSPRPSSRPRRPSRSASCAPRPRSATPTFPTKCRRARNCRSGSKACCAWSTWSSTKAISASSGESATRADLSGEAIRLGRLIVELLPEPEARGLLALMLLHESRRETRADAGRRADPARRAGPLALEPRAHRRRRGAGARGAVHAARRPVLGAGRHRRRARRGADRRTTPTGARSSASTTCCCGSRPRPSSRSTARVALAMRDGPEAGLAQLDQLLAGGELDGYQLAHAARADFCRRLGRNAEAREAYQRAIKLTAQGPARRFLEKRLAALPALNRIQRLARMPKDFSPSLSNTASARSTNSGPTARRLAVKYLCLVYLSPEEWNSAPDSACVACGDELRASGHFIDGTPLHPVHTATTVRVRNGQAIGHRRPVRRNQGSSSRASISSKRAISTRPSRSPRKFRRRSSAASKCAPRASCVVSTQHAAAAAAP